MAVTSKDIALAAEALNRFPGLSPLARRLGIELINHTCRIPKHEQYGKAWPSEARLAEALDVTTRAIRKAKAQLKAHGFLTWEQRGRHPQRTPLYTLAWERLKAAAAEIKDRISKASKPYRKAAQRRLQNLGRNKRACYLTQLSFIGLEGAGSALQPQKTIPVPEALLEKRAHSRLYDALRALPEQAYLAIVSSMTAELEARAVQAERFKPKSGLPTLLQALKQGCVA